MRCPRKLKKTLKKQGNYITPNKVRDFIALVKWCKFQIELDKKFLNEMHKIRVSQEERIIPFQKTTLRIE